MGGDCATVIQRHVGEETLVAGDEPAVRQRLRQEQGGLRRRVGQAGAVEGDQRFQLFGLAADALDVGGGAGFSAGGDIIEQSPFAIRQSVPVLDALAIERVHPLMMP